MNSLQFMDKQVMGIPGSPKDDFFDLLNPQEDQSKNGVGGFNKELKEEILPSYDFQPIRPLGASRSANLEETNVGGARVWNSDDGKASSSNVRTYGSLDTVESANLVQEKDHNAYSSITVSEIDTTMKKHADNLLHALEGVSARLSQLESRTRHLENTVDALNVSIGNDNGKTEGKLRQLENILREVQTGVQVIRDKQEIAEAHLQLAKLQVSKRDQQSENQNSTTQTDTVQQPVPRQLHQPLTAPVIPQPSQQPPALPPPNALPPPTHQNPPPVQLPTQLPPSQIPSVPQQEPYFPPSGPQPDTAHQQYQLPPSQQPHLPPPAPHQPYQSAPPQLPQYSQPPQPPQQRNQPVVPVNPSPKLQPSLSRHPEETPQLPPHSYPPSVRLPPSMTLPHSGPLPYQQFYGGAPNMYESPPSRPSSGISSAYGPPPGSNFSDSSYSGSPQYTTSSMKPHQFSSSAPSSGGSSYPRLPTAQLLPHAQPAASNDSGSSSGGTGNRVPIDDVVDKVSMMGFSREQVRAMVRKLTENGQSVDLNVVLDKLMNDGEVQPPKVWFGR